MHLSYHKKTQKKMEKSKIIERFTIVSKIKIWHTIQVKMIKRGKLHNFEETRE